MNRALNDQCSFYCVVNCHLLRYEVCRVVEDRLSKLASLSKKQFGLAFIYDIKAKDARIKTYLDKQLAKSYELASVEKLQAYVKQILQAPEDVEVSKWCVDPDRYICNIFFS